MPAFPPKTNYAAGDVLTAAQMNDVGNALSAYQFTVGKNKIINGDFNVNQRNFSSTTSSLIYGFDRWRNIVAGGTVTYSAQTFTLGTAPVSGYESKNFARLVTSGQSAASDRAVLTQPIESVRTLAGQTATVSFWAKAASGTPKVAIELQQSFGAGGSPSSAVNNYAGQITLSTTWTRYTATISIPSISGKTLGTSNDDCLILILWTSAGSDWNARTGSLGIQSATIDFWGVQVEAGSTATPFTTASGTIQGELALCQRYYVRFGGGGMTTSGYNRLTTFVGANSTTQAFPLVVLPVPMRTTPSAPEWSGIQLYDGVNFTALTSLTIDQGGQFNTTLNAQVAAGLTQYRPYALAQVNNTSHYLGLSAEL